MIVCDCEDAVLILHKSKTCTNCHYEQVEHVKLHQDPCKMCFKEDKPGNRFPKWKEVK